MSSWNTLQTPGTNLIFQQSWWMDNLTDARDEQLGDNLDEEYAIASLRNFSDTFPSYRHCITLEMIPHNPLDGGSPLRLTRGSRRLCAPRPRGRGHHTQGCHRWATGQEGYYRNRRARPPQHAGVPQGASQIDIPHITTVLEGIICGDLSLHYSRWVWYRAAHLGGTSGLAPFSS